MGASQRRSSIGPAGTGSPGVAACRPPSSLPGEVLHHGKRQAVVLAHVDHLDDVRVGQLDQGADFPGEALDENAASSSRAERGTLMTTSQPRWRSCAW